MAVRGQRAEARVGGGVVSFRELLVATVAALVVITGCGAGADSDRGQSEMQVGSVGAVTEALGTAPETGCTGVTYQGHDYWFCPQLRNWATARSKCEARGYNLVRIEGALENDFIRSHAHAAAWTGANDITTEGTWTWTFGGSRFWSGTSTGTPVSGLFNDWGVQQPDNLGNQDCAQILFNGTWTDESCALALPYVCETGVDQCPADPEKVIPGACGCGVSDVDSDADGMPDCLDQCPNDATKIRPGDCGCSNAPKPSGTACGDGLCAANKTCNGAGVCGNPTTCPAPDTQCTFQVFQNEYYWFCNHDQITTTARQKCQAVGMDMTAVESAAEDRFIFAKGSRTDHILLGGTDEVTEGTWVWRATGQTFWTGGVNGNPAPGAFVSWEDGEPNDQFGGEDCMAKDPSLAGAEWESWKCSVGATYVCEQSDLCPTDPNKRVPGQCGCNLPDTDSDHDGTADCLDQCRLDPAKTSPGLCGCNRPETNSDTDGVPDCKDACPIDPTKTAPGECGCATAPTAASTPCTDGICTGLPGLPHEQACDGHGQCGDPNLCSPDSGHCTAQIFGENVYWFCSGTATWPQAQTKCSAIGGQALSEIDSREENNFIANVITAPTWIGASDQSTGTSWHWTTGTTFFANNTPVNGAFTAWSNGTPADNIGQCAAMLPATSGKWADQNCANSLAYVCKRPNLNPGGHDDPELTCGDVWPGAVCTPDTTPCVTSDPILNTDRDSFRDTVNACHDNCPTDGAPGCSLCTGVASIPPAGSTCAAQTRSPCAITNAHGTCTTTADCQNGEICAKSFDCAACDGKSDCSNVCPSVLRCGAPVDHCSTGNPGDERCGEVTICAPPGSSGDPNPLDDPGSDLTPTTVTPSNFGTPPAKTPNYPADLACATPPCNVGATNNWCKYMNLTPLPERLPSTDAKHGQAGKGGFLSFNFDPNVVLDFQATPLAFGEAKFNVTAAAKLAAGVQFSFPSFGGSPFKIFDANVELDATRCRTTTSNSHLIAFGVDFLPTFAPQTKFDTNPSIIDAAKCDAALDKFETFVDRAKKGLKDAQELLRQYKALAAAGERFPSNFCHQIAADPPLGFPAGDCNSETPEATINRFISFYETQINNAVQQQIFLAGNVLSFSPPPITLGNQVHEEDQLLFSSTFPVGPIPVNLEVQAVERYGVSGDLNFDFAPGSVLLGATSQEEIAHVWGDVSPFANASVSLFVGVGFDIGVASASIGVEGLITLGNITAPIVAGAGIVMQPLPDMRPLPTDLAALAGPTPLISPTEYKFSLKYDYGARIDLNQILKGSLALRLHISFLFFSKTWRAKIIDFGPGFSLPELALFQGQNGGTALGTVEWATFQPPTPFVSLAPLPIPPPPDPSVPTQSFDPSQVGKLFYDGFCTCVEPGDDCFRSPDCCPGAPTCFPDPVTGRHECILCRASAESCNTDADCCSGNPVGCYPTTDGAATKVCTQCLIDGRVCDPKNDQCCGGTTCGLGTTPNQFICQPPPA